MIEAATLSKVVQELSAPDPDFRLEPVTQVPFVVPQSIEVFRANGDAEINWAPPAAFAGAENAREVLERIVTSSQREVERHPSSARTRINLGVALMNAGRLDDAQREFERARQLDSTSGSALAHLSRIGLLKHQPVVAMALARALSDLEPSNLLGPLLVASAAVMQGIPSDAIVALTDAVRKSPKNSFVADYLLGVVLIGEKRIRESIRHLRAAARNNPRSAAVQHALGIAHSLQGNWKLAVRSFREALTLAPKRRETVLALGRVLRHRGDFDQAISVLSDWVAIDQRDREIQELLAGLHQASGNLRAAHRHLQAALHATASDLTQAQDRARLMNNIGVCVGTTGNHEEAVKWYLQSIDVHSTPTAVLNLARAYRSRGNLADARRIIESGRVAYPKDADVQLLSALVAGDLREYDEAITTFIDLVRSDRASPGAYAGLGWILSDGKKEYQRALDFLVDGHEQFPDSSAIANNLAYVFLMLGNAEGARGALASVPELEVAQSVFLTATRGLLHLVEGDLEIAATHYAAAEQLARQGGHRRLAKEVRQKMHLEFARAYLRLGQVIQAREHVRRGLAINGSENYSEDLKEVSAKLFHA